MIPPERFLVQSRNYDGWLAARLTGVSATAVAEGATPAGFRNLIASRGQQVEVNDFMIFGSESEAEIMRFAHREFGTLPNDWLIAGEDRHHIGTPDGLAPDHMRIAEAKTGGTIPKSPPRKHRDQCQWNMHVTGAAECVYLFQHRQPTDDGWFFLALLEPLVWVIERDDDRIGELVIVADRILEATSGELQPR